jgi:hypothetical protein
MKGDTRLRAGDWVEVRSKEEILATLDKKGQLEALPFMPEMFRYCGQRFQVFKRAHKTCDPPSGLQGRRLAHAVHLSGLRCDGSSHGGCQAGCLIFWKEAWLKSVDGREPTSAGRPPDGSLAAPLSPEDSAAKRGGWAMRCTEEDVRAAVHQASGADTPEAPTFACQSTQLFAATTPLSPWDVRQYLEDLTSGNVRLSQLIAAAVFFVYHTLAEAGLGLGSAMRWAYDAVQKVRGGPSYPLRAGKIPRGARTPSAKLDLRPGEFVRVRSYSEILQTLDEDWHNRGMYFDGEQVPFCNGSYRVLGRVERIIDEKSGRLIQLKNDAIILDNVACQARYAKCRLFCSRSIYPYWREIWLERVDSAGSEPRRPAQAAVSGASSAAVR